MPVALPTSAEFDTYAVGPGAAMSAISTYTGVSFVADGSQFFLVGNDLVLTSGGPISGGTAATTDARMYIGTPVGLTWTFEAVFEVTDLPSDFSDIPNRHVFFGVADLNGGAAGLFFSATGLAYAGSIVFNGGGTLVLNSAVQILPNSPGLVQPDVFYSVRIVVDFNTKTTFIYVTKTADLTSTGHQLRFVLPAFTTAVGPTTPQEGTIVSVRGTVFEPSSIEIGSVALGSGLIIPNLPPVADAGVDQAARSCTIVQLDGRSSFDPEGAPLAYAWRLIDGPYVSAFVLTADDGRTLGFGLTDRFYTDSGAAWLATPGVVPGDVLLVDGEPYAIAGTGTDGNGFYFRASGVEIPAGLPKRPFRVLRQNAVTNPTTVQPTFYPDVPGLYKFDLAVSDGGLSSDRASTIVNVTESPIPRGITPDVRFLWNYISDFGRLVEGTEVIETFWSALAQVAASELLTLWQHEYSKSLRDVQTTFQRRWLHYDLYLEEPEVESTTVHAIRGGLRSKTLTSVPSFAGTKLELVVGGQTFQVFLTQPGSPTPENVRALLAQRLWEVAPGISVEVQQTQNLSSFQFVLRADFPFMLTANATATSLFTLPASNDLPRGTAGSPIGLNSYRLDRSITGDGVAAGDYLVVDGAGYRIARVVTDPGDVWGEQRVVLVDDLPTSAGSTWVIAGATRSRYLDFYNSLCSAGDTAIYEVVNRATGELGYVATDVLAAVADGSTALLTEQAAIAWFLASSNYDVYLQSVYRRTFMPIDPLVVEIPVLQEKIKNSDDTQVLRQNIDFFRTDFRGHACVRFVTGVEDVWQGDLPPKRVWAETTYIDNRPVIEQNFGIPAEFTLDNLADVTANVDYLSIVRGLWYAYFSGPTIYNLRVGTQILLGLPFAEEAGTILALEPTFSPSQGRILVQDANEQAIVRSYTYPRVLDLEVNPRTGVVYAIGDAVPQFAPLVKGAEVIDYVTDPNWFVGYRQQGSLFEVEKFFKFLVRVDSAAFNLQSLLFANQFVKRIKPTYTYPLIVVRSTINEATVEVTDDVSAVGHLQLYAGPNFGTGQANMFDQPRGAGGYWNRLDQSDPNTAPTYPNPTLPVNWGMDRYTIAPREGITAILRRTVGVGGELPAADSIYYADMPIFTELTALFETGAKLWIDSAGTAIGDPKTMTATRTLTKLLYCFRLTPEVSDTFTLTVLKNGSTVSTQTVTPPLGGYARTPNMFYKAITTSIGVVSGDIITATLTHAVTGKSLFLEAGVVVLGLGQDWLPDTLVPAGTYMTVLAL